MYGAFILRQNGSVAMDVYSEILEDLKAFVDERFSGIKAGQSIGVWQMDEDGNFSDLSQGASILYKQK